MSLVKVESSEGITTITMARPEKRNALTQELCDGLYEAYRAFEHGDDQVAVGCGGDRPGGAEFRGGNVRRHRLCIG